MIIEIIGAGLLLLILLELMFIAYELKEIYNALVTINKTNVKIHNLILKERQ